MDHSNSNKRVWLMHTCQLVKITMVNLCMKICLLLPFLHY